MTDAVDSSHEPVPGWLWEVLGSAPAEDRVTVRGRQLMVRDGVLRDEAVYSAAQAHTAEAFGFKWDKREAFESEATLARARAWLVERYGDVARAGWWQEYGEHPLVVDAGCGAAMSVLELFGEVLPRVRFLGVDISSAVDLARRRSRERGLTSAAFMQADLADLPLPAGCADVVFSEGVLHHTDSTEDAFHAVVRLLRHGGRFLFYVYRRKAPIREFVDDYVRDRISDLPPADAWEQLMPLTRLGKHLGEIDVVVDVPEEVALLGIPKGPMPLQRFLYWYVFKAFHHPDFSLDELNAINYDWYAPTNAHRHTIEEVRGWCAAAGLSIERERIEDAGITVVARRT